MATRGLLCGVEGGAPQEVVVSRTGRSKCPRCIVRCHAAPPSVDALLSMLTSCVERKTERNTPVLVRLQSWGGGNLLVRHVLHVVQSGVIHCTAHRVAMPVHPAGHLQRPGASK
jgi:hypothetical protein